MATKIGNDDQQDLVDDDNEERWHVSLQKEGNRGRKIVSPSQKNPLHCALSVHELDEGSRSRNEEENQDRDDEENKSRNSNLCRRVHSDV